MMRNSTNKAIRPTADIERNILTKNTKIIGEIISDGDFRIDGTLEGSLKTNGRVVIGEISVEPGASFNATCVMKGAIKELKQDANQQQYRQKQAN